MLLFFFIYLFHCTLTWWCFFYVFRDFRDIKLNIMTCIWKDVNRGIPVHTCSKHCCSKFRWTMKHSWNQTAYVASKSINTTFKSYKKNKRQRTRIKHHQNNGGWESYILKMYFCLLLPNDSLFCFMWPQTDWSRLFSSFFSAMRNRGLSFNRSPHNLHQCLSHLQLYFLSYTHDTSAGLKYFMV